MSRTVEVSWRWNDEAVYIRADMAPAEHDVGIFNPYPVGMTVEKLDGSRVELTDADCDRLMEEDGLADKLVEAYYDREM